MNKSVLTFTSIQPHHLRRREEAKLVGSVTRVLLAHYFNDAQLEHEQNPSNCQSLRFQTTKFMTVWRIVHSYTWGCCRSQSALSD